MLTLRTITRFTGILCSVLLLGTSFAHAQAEAGADAPQTPVMSKQELLTIQETDHVLGDKDAPVTVIEYASLSCNHCMRFHTQTLPQLKKDYVETGKVAYVYRHFPLNAPALHGAVLAECAGDRFYNYLDVMFKSQPEWAYDANFLDSLRTMAKIGGVGEEAFEACLADKELENRLIQGMQQAAVALEVKSTPTVFINGEKMDGYHSIEEMAPVIDAALKAAKKN